MVVSFHLTMHIHLIAFFLFQHIRDVVCSCVAACCDLFYHSSVSLLNLSDCNVIRSVQSLESDPTLIK